MSLGTRTTIGRVPQCDIVVPDPTISRVQAVIEQRVDGFYLIDRSSRGTRINGREVVEPMLLHNGDTVLFGSWQAIFRDVDTYVADQATQVPGLTSTLKVIKDAHDKDACLRIRRNGEERLVSISSPLFTIGKAAGNHLVLEDQFVSSQHAKLEQREGRWYFTDLSSTNGTWLSGCRVLHAELFPGASLTIGDTKVTLELVNANQKVSGPKAIPSFEGIVSQDPLMRQVFETIEHVAASEAAVAIHGETGTGKELVARALHGRSFRRDGPLVTINCSGFSESLTDSELFGHIKGAFTGAQSDKKGLFEAAHEGTLFLDEIGELPMNLQPKLLRALELGEVRRVGATSSRQVSVRAISATHRDLIAHAAAGKFREDLYYRMSVIPIHLPPLRNRRGDIRLLTQHFFTQIAPRDSKISWSEEALKKLEDYHWPGNIRQLKNVLQRTLLLRNQQTVISPETVVLEEVGGLGSRANAPVRRANDNCTLNVEGKSLEEVEREVIRLSLRRHRGKRISVMKELQVSKTTLIKKISDWGLQNEGLPESEWRLSAKEGDVE